MQLPKAATAIQAFFKTETGKKLVTLTKNIVLVLILAYIVRQLLEIGWEDVLVNLPTNPLFYLLFFVIYFQLPIAEMFAYRVSWHFPFWASLPAFLKKRIYNKEVVGYSGEFYFYAWTRKALNIEKKEVFRTIRDNNTLSSIASTIVTLLMLAFFLSVGAFKVDDLLPDNLNNILIMGAIILPVLMIILYKFRKYLFNMPLKASLIILGIHAGRLLFSQTVQIFQWYVALPDVALVYWFTFASISIVLTRFPFLPNHDLLFMSFGIGMAGPLGLNKSEIAAMFLVLTVLNKLTNLIFFLGLTGLQRVGVLANDEDILDEGLKKDNEIDV